MQARSRKKREVDQEAVEVGLDNHRPDAAVRDPEQVERGLDGRLAGRRITEQGSVVCGRERDTRGDRVPFGDEIVNRHLKMRVSMLHHPGVALVGSSESNARMMQHAYSHLEVTIDDLIAEGDTVATRVTFTATHYGPLLGDPATGKPAV